MEFITYKSKQFGKAKAARIAHAMDIIEEYQEMGIDLTLRQLYYQFVSRDLCPNKQNEYDKIVITMTEARLAGLVPWDCITDKTRSLMGLRTHNSPADAIRSSVYSYRTDLWKGQPQRPEVWIEKEALVSVINQPCNNNRVDFFACRGYPSISSAWEAGQRFLRRIQAGQQPVIIHLGDHDPSGIDMTRDIIDRIELFCDQKIEVNRIALNMDQVRQHNPPPNPAKESDCRAKGYIEKFGMHSWELDALDPPTLAGLINDAIAELRDDDAWAKAKEKEDADKTKLEGFLRKLEDEDEADDADDFEDEFADDE